ncbi:uncharacterized protein LOC135468341 [Liolophura sinensis]|uniref:uncharacterized protein LOC135468341 n=1 Tax=Liolophura sinensis TaxID=3198878 RepID=UPI00315801D1
MFSRMFILLLAVSPAFCFGETEDVSDKSHKDLEELAEFAVGEIYGKTDGRLPPVRVVDVQKQIVAGVNYFFTLQITFPDKSVHVCEATIHTQPWKQTRELLKSDCPSMIDTLNIGKVVQQLSLSPSDPEVERAAKFAVERLNHQSKCFKDARLELINKALETEDVITMDLTVCEWPFSSYHFEKRIPYPCALQENLHDCHVAVDTKDGAPVKLVGDFHCSGC